MYGQWDFIRLPDHINSNINPYMFLSQTAEYALRAVTCVLLNGESEPVNARQLSEKTGVPVHYLSKIMRKLVEAGIIRARKGHHGGFQLDKKPEEICLADVLHAVGLDLEDRPCVFGWAQCRNDDPCPLHPVWVKLKDSFREWSETITLEDIRRENGELRDLEKWKSPEA